MRFGECRLQRIGGCYKVQSISLQSECRVVDPSVHLGKRSYSIRAEMLRHRFCREMLCSIPITTIDMRHAPYK